MQRKKVNRLLRITGVLTIIIWVLGLFGVWGGLYGILVMAMITLFFVLIFIGFMNDNGLL